MKIKLVIKLIILTLVISNCNLIQTEGDTTKSDYPKELTNKIDTIEIEYIAWACACANWLPNKYFDLDNDILSENPENYCIFLEAEKEDLRIPDEYCFSGFENRIRLIGSYYKDKGISKDFMQSTSQKPDKAKVFKYSEIEIIKPFKIWDFENKDEDGLAKTILIKKNMKSIFETNKNKN
jgi:hypothetical protein